MKYRDAGVNIDAAHAALARIKALVRSTYTEGVLTDLGLFAGAFSAKSTGLKDPILLSSIDGVGTKLKIAAAARKFKSVGRDVVSHCCNDILVHGAQPLFLLDYVAMCNLDPAVLEEVVGGMAEECIGWGCALIGGETAEMPGMYNPGELDLVGCVVGVVEKEDFVDGAAIRPGDRVIGLPSTGLHTNGYSLARKILFEEAGHSLQDAPGELGCSIEEALLAPHRGYRVPVRALLSKRMVTGMAHITGGGLYDNVSRILPAGAEVHIREGSWPVPPLFSFLTRLGGVEKREALRTFNMGIGYVVFVREDNGGKALAELRAMGEGAFLIGEVVRGDSGVVIA
ncbi:MAG: phosphoribosylformylglycinamidine cyclo-ligase [Candidatus Eisenbacteria bacterium]